MEPKCGARSATGKPCRKPAGWGTNHPGIGHCKWHEDRPDVTVHRYPPLMYLMDPELRPLVLRMIQDDNELLNLRYELAVLRARFLQMANEGSDKDLSGLARAISGLATSVQEMENTKHMLVHVSVIALVLQAVGQVAGQYVEERKRAAFAADLKDAIRKLLPETTAKSIASTALVEQTALER